MMSNTENCRFVTIRENANPTKKIARIDLNQINCSYDAFLDEAQLPPKTRIYTCDGLEISASELSSIRNEDVIYADRNGNDFSFKTYLLQYEKINSLGKGGFGSVFKAKNIITGDMVAIKYIDITYCLKDATKLQGIFKESNALKSLNHKNIIKLYHTFLHDNNVVLIMEIADGGELKTYVEKQGFLSESEARNIFRQLVDALGYCHGRYIIHRDIKMENIIFKSETDRTIKLIDFGIAGTNYGEQGSKINAGSLLYMAPEIFEGKYESSPAIDIWSMGVLLYVMVYGKMPFMAKSEDSTINEIVHKPHAFPADRKVTSECKNLISQMLQKDPSKRLKMYEITFHEWFNIDEGILQEIFDKESKERKEKEEKKLRDEELLNKEIAELMKEQKKKKELCKTSGLNKHSKSTYPVASKAKSPNIKSTKFSANSAILLSKK